MQKTFAHVPVNPFVIFWLGLLTGALVVGFVFLYRALNSNDYTNALLKYSYSTQRGAKSLKTFDSTSINTPGF